MLPSYWNRSITVLRAPQIPGRGSDMRWDWDNAVEHVVTGCFWSAPQTSENNVFREAVNIKYVLRMPANVDMKSTDRVRLYVGAKNPDEPDFEIVGIVRDVPSASGSMDHKRAELNVWQG